MALIEAYRATGNELALERALELIAFAEKSYLGSDGLFAVGLSAEPDPEKWMWSVEDIEKVLAPEDAAWWIEATGMKGLGNLPSEVDPRREFFRLNTIGLSKPMEQIAAELSLTPEAFVPRFEAVRAKLLSSRNSRVGKTPPDESPHAASCFRMVSAYAGAFAVTGDEIYREKAVSLLNRSREAFGVGREGQSAQVRIVGRLADDVSAEQAQSELSAVARTPLLPKSYLEVEGAASGVWHEAKQGDA